MPRQINFDILFNFSGRNGRFLDRDPNANDDDNSRFWTSAGANGVRVPVPPILNRRLDSVTLGTNDTVTVRFGYKQRVRRGDPMPTPIVQRLDAAVTIGRRLDDGQPPQNIASPFGGVPQTVFVGSLATMELETQQDTDRDGSSDVTFFYKLPLGTVTEAGNSANPSQYAMMIGANVQTANGSFSFGHDPEIDVGTEQ
ncbi:MAG: hypothetical protein JNK48_20440 [Bryobacterales bacterium]|nr:hypothetical protein [Bryobacterales bacterium]